MKLYEIDNAIRDVVNNGFAVDMETGEITFEAKDLDNLIKERIDKLEGCAVIAKEFDSKALALRAEEKALAERRKALERKSEHLKAYMLAHLEAGEQIETRRASIKTRKSYAVEVTGEVPKKYIVEKVTYQPDKKAIAAAIKAGGRVKGAELVERVNLVLK
jgi:seryl-tRNA synthetase